MNSKNEIRLCPIFVFLFISILGVTSVAQETNMGAAEIQDSLEFYKKKISSYKEYYTKMIRLSDEKPGGLFIQSQYVIHGRQLGKPFLSSEIKASKKESTEAAKLFKKANKCNVSSGVLSLTGAVIGPVGILMVFIGIFSDDPRSMIGTGLALAGVGLTVTLVSIPISTIGIKAKRNGYLKYDKELRRKYAVSYEVVIKDE